MYYYARTFDEWDITFLLLPIAMYVLCTTYKCVLYKYLTISIVFVLTLQKFPSQPSPALVWTSFWLGWGTISRTSASQPLTSWPSKSLELEVDGIWWRGRGKWGDVSNRGNYATLKIRRMGYFVVFPALATPKATVPLPIFYSSYATELANPFCYVTLCPINDNGRI